MKVPYVDIKAQYTERSEVLEVIAGILARGQFILGPEVEIFERAFAKLCRTKYAVAVSSGTDALFLGLKSWGIGVGDEVITVPNTFLSTVAAISVTGATPVLVDVGEDYNMDPDRLKEGITPRTRAVIPVHLTGRPARMTEINEIAKEYGLNVLEDAAQAVGASWDGTMVGSLGDMGAFSLHPLKNLNVPGDGGVITTSDPAIFHQLCLLRNHGLKNRNESVVFSYNSRLDTLKAAVASLMLRDLKKITRVRNEHADYYDEKFKDISEVIYPSRIPEIKEAFHTYVIQVEKRDELVSYLTSCGVETKIHYPLPVHLMEAARGLGYRLGDFPISEKQSEMILSLPIHQHLLQDQLEYVVESIKKFYSGLSVYNR